MPPYLSFLDDAEARFLEAFALFELIGTTEPDKRTWEPVVQCVRGFYLALEKGLKHALAEIDPYLLIAKPDRTLLLDLRRDLRARPAPSIFCSRQPFDTIGLTQTWDSLRSLDAAGVDEQIVADFDRALRRLTEVRHRAQHAELLDDIEEVYATIEQLLARFSTIADAWVPEWLHRLYQRNGQLESRLHAIENHVDASWQVLTDYLRSQGPIHLTVTLYSNTELDRDSVQLLFGNSKQPNRMLAEGDVPKAAATGLFQKFLTPQQASDRYAERQRLKALASAEGTAAPVSGALTPLDAGAVAVPSTTAWLWFSLPITPPQLFVSAALTGVQIEFGSPTELTGRVAGQLQCRVLKENACADAVSVAGPAYLTSEYYWEGDPQADPPEPPQTRLALDLELELSLAPRSVAPAAEHAHPADCGAS